MVEVVHDGGDVGGDQLGEGPVWDERSQLLFRVDVVGGAVLALDTLSGAERRYEVGQPVGCLVLRADGAGLLLAVRDGFAALDLASGELALLGPVDHDPAVMQLNDGGCDPAGRFYAGSIARDASPGRGVLYRYEPPASVSAVVTGLGVSNGLAWDDAGSCFLIDSLERRVDRFAYSVETGELSGRRVAFDLAEYEGIPDGMEIDAEGCLWIAFWRGGAVRRFTPDGRLLEEISFPVRRTTSCCLGGPDLTTLFVTTARRSLRSTTGPEPLGGAVFAATVTVPGMPARRWRDPSVALGENDEFAPGPVGGLADLADG